MKNPFKNIDFSAFKIPDLSGATTNIHIPKHKTPKSFNDFEPSDPHEVTNKILTFLQYQSAIAERQFKTSRNLIWATIIIMILQISYAFWTNYESNSRQNNLKTIIETQSKQSETISRMTLSLIDLQNQVQTSEESKQ